MEHSCLAYVYHLIVCIDFDSSTLQKQTDDQLFVVDTKGDDKGKLLQDFSR